MQHERSEFVLEHMLSPKPAGLFYMIPVSWERARFSQEASAVLLEAPDHSAEYGISVPSPQELRCGHFTSGHLV